MIDPPTQAATTFTFDALGRHATRVTPAATDTYAYVGTSETVRSLVNAVTTRAAISPDGSRVAIKAGTTVGFSLADLHGNQSAVVNAGETAYLSATRYDPYGQTAATYDSGGSFPRPWGFQGRLDLSPVSSDPLYDMSARKSGATLGFSLADLHGNTAAVVNAGETAYLSATRYDPYGQTAATYDSGGAFPRPWGFQGRLDLSPVSADPCTT